MRMALKSNRRGRGTRISPPRLRLASGRRLSGRRRNSATPRPALRREMPVAPAPTVVDNSAPPIPATEHAHGDTLQLYLREIGQIKLLTPAEEITLAKRIRRGDSKAREQMIKANLRLVVKIARDYEGLGLPLLDLVNEGNIGLMKGVERFDPSKGAKLSTYASWWIKQAIKRALANQSKTIRLPVHVVDKVADMRRAEVKLREALDRDPTDEEIAEELKMSPRRVRMYRQASRAPVSLDAPLGNEDDSAHVAEVVADPNAVAPFERLASANDHALVREVLATLSERESRILALRFGLDDGKPKTLEEVGEHFDVTRERIRQIQEEALQKLRERMEERDSGSREEVLTLVR